MISFGRIPEMDSLSKTSHLAKITFADIKSNESTSFRIFPKRKKDQFHLFLDDNNQMFAVDLARASTILIERKFLNHLVDDCEILL